MKPTIHKADILRCSCKVVHPGLSYLLPFPTYYIMFNSCLDSLDFLLSGCSNFSKGSGLHVNQNNSTMPKQSVSCHFILEIFCHISFIYVYTIAAIHSSPHIIQIAVKLMFSSYSSFCLWWRYSSPGFFLSNTLTDLKSHWEEVISTSPASILVLTQH